MSTKEQKGTGRRALDFGFQIHIFVCILFSLVGADDHLVVQIPRAPSAVSPYTQYPTSDCSANSVYPLCLLNF